MSYPEPDRRSLITSLRDFAAFLEAHPDVPAPYHVDLMVFPRRDSDGAMCAEIDRVAAAINSPTEDERTESGHYRTSRSFGLVTYTAVAILANARARYDALMSYHHSVTPDTPKAVDER